MSMSGTLPKRKRRSYDQADLQNGLDAGFKPGDPRPEGYVAFFSWAAVQKAAGINQTYCRRCRLWLFPQEPHPHLEEP